MALRKEPVRVVFAPRRSSARVLRAISVDSFGRELGVAMRAQEDGYPATEQYRRELLDEVQRRLGLEGVS